MLLAICAMIGLNHQEAKWSSKKAKTPKNNISFQVFEIEEDSAQKKRRAKYLRKPKARKLNSNRPFKSYRVSHFKRPIRKT